MHLSFIYRYFISKEALYGNREENSENQSSGIAWLEVAKFKLLVRDQNYGLSRLTATYAGPTSGSTTLILYKQLQFCPRWSIPENKLYPWNYVEPFPKSFIKFQFSPWKNFLCEKISQSTNQSKHRMVEGLMVVLNFGVVLSLILLPDTGSFIFLNHNFCPNFSRCALRIFWIQFYRSFPSVSVFCAVHRWKHCISLHRMSNFSAQLSSLHRIIL